MVEGKVSILSTFYWFFPQAHYRKAIALWELPHIEGNIEKSAYSLRNALEIEPDNEEMLQFLARVEQEIKEDSVLPKDDPEVVRFNKLFDWMKEGGATFDKLKIRYYGPDYRGVHAARDIKQGETILFVPNKELITLEMAFETPIGA